MATPGKTRLLVGVSLLVGGLLLAFDAVERSAESGGEPSPDELAGGIKASLRWIIQATILLLAGIVFVVLVARSRGTAPATK